MHISPLDNLAAIFSGECIVWPEIRKDCRCYECRRWVEETTTFFDEEETGKEINLCNECLEIYEQ